MEERNAQRSPSKESCNSLELDDFIKKIILGAQESLHNSSQSSSINASSNKEALANVSSIMVSLKNQMSPDVNEDQTNDTPADASVATAVTMESSDVSAACITVAGNTNEEDLNSAVDSPDVTDATPVTALVPDSCKVDNSVVTCVTPAMDKEPSEQSLDSSNEESTALKSETAVSFTIAEHKHGVSIEDQPEIPERSSGKNMKLRAKFMKCLQANKVAPQENETGETSLEKRSVKIALQASITDWEEVIIRTGERDCEGRDIFLINLQNLPERKALSSYILTYINNNLTSERFVILVKTENLKENIKTRYALAKELYQMLRNSFSDKLSSCLIYRPDAKLKTLFYLTRPFIQRKMRNKISIAKTTKKVVECHGIPDTILRRF